MGKKEAQEAVAIRDPDTGTLVVETEEIKKVTLKYCEENLRKSCEDSEERRVKEECHRKRMEEKDEEECNVSKEDFNAVMRKFKSKKSKAYDFILKTSDEFKDAVFRLCKFFMRKEEIPKRMQMTTLNMIILVLVKRIHLRAFPY